MYIENLAIEITRRCNMKCAHCLRWNAQWIDLDLKHTNTFFRKLYWGRIWTLTFTWWEPSLKPEIIEAIRMQLHYNKIQLDSFYIATNGKKISKEFIDVCYMLYWQCNDNENSRVDVSVDRYHKEILNKNEASKLECFTFIWEKWKELWCSSLIKQGRAKNRGWRDLKDYGFFIEEYEDTVELREWVLYLNVKGELISWCDWSYVEQKKHKICSVYDDFTEILYNKYLDNNN